MTAMLARAVLLSALVACAACNGSVQVETTTGGGNAGSGQGGTGGPVTGATGGGTSTAGGTAGTGGTTAGGAGTAGVGGTGGVGPFCGDGTIDPGEACDDGNASDSDACSSACAVLLMTLSLPAAISEWPDVAATGHDGGNGFLVVWRGNLPGDVNGGIGLPISAKGIAGTAQKVVPGQITPAVAALPDNQAFVAMHANDPSSLEVAVIDATTLTVSQETTGMLPGKSLSYLLLATNQLGEVGTAYHSPWDDVAQAYPVHACVLFPDLACWAVGQTTVSSYSSIAPEGDHWVAATPTPAGFDFVLFDNLGPAGTFPVDEPTAPSVPHLVPRPGGFLAAWQTVSQSCAYFRLFDGDLVPVGPSQLVEGSCEDKVYGPRVAVGPTGRFIVVYQRLVANLPPYPCHVVASVFEADGTPSIPPFSLDEGPGCNGDVRVAANPQGDVLVVWNRDDSFALVDVIEAKLLPQLLQ